MPSQKEHDFFQSSFFRGKLAEKNFGGCGLNTIHGETTNAQERWSLSTGFFYLPTQDPMVMKVMKAFSLKDSVFFLKKVVDVILQMDVTCGFFNRVTRGPFLKWP